MKKQCPCCKKTIKLFEVKPKAFTWEGDELIMWTDCQYCKSTFIKTFKEADAEEPEYTEEDIKYIKGEAEYDDSKYE